MNAATWGTMLVELALGVLVWNKRCRLWVLAAGVLLHLGIDLNIEIGIFSYAMLVLYVAWIAPAPTPCSARKTMSATMLHAPEQAADPARKTAMPNSSTGLRP